MDDYQNFPNPPPPGSVAPHYLPGHAKNNLPLKCENVEIFHTTNGP